MLQILIKYDSICIDNLTFSSHVSIDEKLLLKLSWFFVGICPDKIMNCKASCVEKRQTGCAV